jgi:hypothetical protein
MFTGIDGFANDDCKKVHLTKVLGAMSESLQSQQKDISRCIAPTVRGGLYDGYSAAGPPAGPGSSARRKVRSFAASKETWLIINRIFFVDTWMKFIRVYSEGP